MELLDRVITEDPRCVPQRDTTLNIQFSENVKDSGLMKHLNWILRQFPDIILVRSETGGY